MKKNRISLDSLNVKSFVTNLRAQDFKGGAPETWYCSLNTKCKPSVDMPCISQGAEVCSDDSC